MPEHTGCAPSHLAAKAVCPALEQLLTWDGFQSSSLLHCTLPHCMWGFQVWACKQKLCPVRRWMWQTFLRTAQRWALGCWQQCNPRWPRSALGCAACTVCRCLVCLPRAQPTPASVSGCFCAKACPCFGVRLVSCAGLMSLGMPRGKEWSLADLHHGQLWCLLCSHRLRCRGVPWSPDSIHLPDTPGCGQGGGVSGMKFLLSWGYLPFDCWGRKCSPLFALF